MSNKRRRCALDLLHKIDIINKIESGKKQTVIAASIGVAKTTINTVWQDRVKIRQAYESGRNNSSKRMRTATFDDIEEALTKWLTHARSDNVLVSGPLLREKAHEFAKLLKHDEFQCSGGWLDRFKTRHGMSCVFTV